MRKERNKEETTCINQTTIMHSCPYTHMLLQSNALCKGKLSLTVKDLGWDSVMVYFPALMERSSGCSWCWHFHSRFPSGPSVPPDSHLLSPGLLEAQTQQIFLMCCRPVSALNLRDSLSFPQTHCDCRHQNWALRKVAHEWFHKLPESQRNSNCCSTALLWLLTHPVNLLAWLELCKMWALPVFHESATMLAKQAWQYTTL